MLQQTQKQQYEKQQKKQTDKEMKRIDINDKSKKL